MEFKYKKLPDEFTRGQNTYIKLEEGEHYYIFKRIFRIDNLHSITYYECWLKRTRLNKKTNTVCEIIPNDCSFSGEFTWAFSGKSLEHCRNILKIKGIHDDFYDESKFLVSLDEDE